MKAFEKYTLKDMEIRNRIVMPPMCMYSSDDTGSVQEFHKMHYGARAIGGTGLIIQEATAVEPRGRISDRDLGLWSDDQLEGMKNLVEIIKGYGAKAGIQLAHAGRKSESISAIPVAPSPIPFSDDYRTPHELGIEEIKEVREKFKEAAKRALLAGYDLVEIHAAHGYLIHEFLSPITNRRTDQYGGSLENRTRFLKEVIQAVKEVWPDEKPLIIRVSATDYLPGGIDGDEIVRIVDQVKKEIDMVHVSSGAIAPAQMNLYPGYQVQFAEKIRKECDIPTIAVGLIKNFDQVEEILQNERADLVALGREILRNPNWVWSNMHDHDIETKYPDQYFRAFK
ncbi:NADPH dehydrogenase NamA [Gudongella sp. DL1XJH-153]|uniref:NADPH dehydrogenase NamA n=1 Tax=Gudongella sp. DL1XJH-153 TaxID=3409804 RepID=UPI003BB7C9A0